MLSSCRIMLKYAHATPPTPLPPEPPSTNSAPHEGSDNVVGVVVICPTAQDVIQHEAAAPPRPHPPSHGDLLIFLYAYIYIYVYVFCMRGAWLTYFKIMPASNKGKKRVQISVCFRSFRSCQRRVSTRGGQGRTPARCI